MTRLVADAHVKVLGIDFTSAPGRKKPITCAEADFDGRMLRIKGVASWQSYDGFESALREASPWIAAIDFPFGQSRRFVENIGWPNTWPAYVEHVAALSRGAFRTELERYKSGRASGDKHHKRRCDVVSDSQSPQTLYGTPVGLMFYEGAKRVLSAGVHIPYHRVGEGDRTVVEGYPGVAVRALVGNVKYKNDLRSRQTQEQLLNRREILSCLVNGQCRSVYGFEIQASERYAEDPSGDQLDAVLCAIQAAWGWSQRHRRFGAPEDQDHLEGWICDPALLRTV